MTDNTLFSNLTLPDTQLHNLQELGYKQMTPIQAKSLPEIIQGRDLIAQAKTGSGKTAAFGIGLLNKLNPKKFRVQVLVLCPTRELATQVANELRRLARYLPNIKMLTLCGGQSIGPQIGSLQHGAHVIVGTPGRIKDHLRKNTLKLDDLHTLVLDEADRMLEMGFNQDIRDIAGHSPNTRQTLLFSATYPDEIKELSSEFQKTPVEVSVESIHSDSQIRKRFIEVAREEKANTLIKLLQHYRPESCVVFCNTKQQCQDLSQQLHDSGFSARSLQGDMEQKDRDMVLIQFSNRSCSVLVATDVAARGLDIDDLSAVINFDLPHDPDIYVHRIGRTGRAGKDGLALSLATPRENFRVRAIEDYTQQEAQFDDPAEIPVNHEPPAKPKMVTLCIAGGRKQKVRPGDILGALTGDAGIPGKQVGKINIYDFYSYVAVERIVAREAQDRLLSGKIKGRKFKVRRL